METFQFFSQIRELIARDEVETALKHLRVLLENSPKLDDAILQSARFNAVREHVRLGLVDYKEAVLTQNQVRHGLLELLREIETQGAAPALRQEMEHAVSIVGEIVVSGTQISAGGNVHIGNIIYNTAPAAGSPPKRDYNKTLTRALVEAMRSHNDKAEKLCQDFSWLEHPENRLKVQHFVCHHFVGEIGKQLRKLVNIGDHDQMDPALKERHYAQKCLEIARRSLDLVNYALLSVWWDASKPVPPTLEGAEQRSIETFFEAHLEQRLDAQFAFLETLYGLFRRHTLAFPFGKKMEDLAPQFAEGSPLRHACAQLEQAVQAGDCTEAETQLANLMRHFAFLTQYRMVSIKKISYRQMRNGKPEYLHRYVALGIDVKYSEDAEKGRWVSMGEQTPAVLLYQGDDYQNGINLFPFVIDYNALTFEQGARICFYSARDLNDPDALDYRFLGDNSVVRIEKKGIQNAQTKLDELMMNLEELKTLNLDCVVDGFHKARQETLGTPNSFFDTL